MSQSPTGSAGAPPMPPAGPPVPPPSARPPTSGLAVVGFVCSIAGVCLFGLPCVAGLITGAVALRRIGASGGALSGRGLAIAGIVIGVVGVLVWLIIGGFAAYAACHAVDLANCASCANNLHQLAKATMVYTTAHNGALPPPDGWPEALGETFEIPEDTFLCPATYRAGRTYAMNARLRDTRLPDIRNPSQTVLFFECVPGSPPAGGMELVPPEPPHAKRYNVAFCDGHVEGVSRDDLDRFTWDPRSAPR